MNRSELAAKAVFLEKLGNLLDAGISLYRATELLEKETAFPKTREIAGKIRAVIEENGENFDLATCLPPDCFSETEKAMLLASAKAGRLDRGCLQVVKWLDRELAYQG